MRRDLPPTEDMFSRLRGELAAKKKKPLPKDHDNNHATSFSLSSSPPPAQQLLRSSTELVAQQRTPVHLAPLSPIPAAAHHRSPAHAIAATSDRGYAVSTPFSSMIPTTTNNSNRHQRSHNHHSTNNNGMLSLASVGSTDHLHSGVVDVPLPNFLDADDENIPLDSQKQTLVSWMKHYAHELSKVDSSTMAAEVLLAQITMASSSQASASASGGGTIAPHALRLAAVCAVAENVCDVVGRFRPLLRPVLDELYRCTYLPQGAAAPREELVASRMVSLGIQPAESVRLQQFLARKPYFEQAKDFAKNIASLELQILALSSSKYAGRSVLDRVGGSLRFTVTNMVFKAWRGAAQRARSQNAILNRFMSNIHRKDVLEAHFYAWRLIVKDQQLARSREEYARSIEQLVQQEATTNVKYLEVDDQLYESKMVVARLKVEKDLQKIEREQLQHATEMALVQAEGWRKVTTDIVAFMASLRKHMTSSTSMIGMQHLQGVTDVALHTLLGWAGKVIEPLPQAGKLKKSLTNFSTDMKDGMLLVLIVHVLTKGDVDLRVLQETPDAKGRLQIVLDALSAPPINIVLPLTIEDVFPPNPEMNFLLLYVMWFHFEAPPIPGAGTALGFTGSYRDDLEETMKYLEQTKAFYPSWLEKRHLLQQYAMFVLSSKMKNLPPQVLTDIEATEREKERSAFSLTSTTLVPSAFLTALNLTPSQRFQNEEERDRVNAVIQRHMGAIRHLFEKYASKSSPFTESILAIQEADRKVRVQSINALRPSRRGGQGGRGGGGGSGKGDASSGVPEGMYRDVIVEMDAIGFYRFCCDAGLCVRGQPTQPMTAAQTAQQRKDNRKKDMNQILSEPRNLTKLQILEIYVDIILKWPSTDTSDPDPSAAPGAFVALLVNLAVHRFGQPLTTIQQPTQPSPAGALMEIFIKKDLMSAIGVVESPTAFLKQVFHPSIQETVFLRRRMVLRALFEMYSSTPKNSVLGPTKSLNKHDFVRLCVEIFPDELQEATGITATATVNATPTPPPPGGDAGVAFEGSLASTTALLAGTAHSIGIPESQFDATLGAASLRLEGEYVKPEPESSVPQRPITIHVVEETFDDAVLCFLPEGPANQHHQGAAAAAGSSASPVPSRAASPPGSPARPGSPVFSNAGSAGGASSPKGYLVGAQGENEELRMIYGEFEIALAAFSLHLEPSPFIDFQQKLIHFLDNRVLSSAIVQTLV